MQASHVITEGSFEKYFEESSSINKYLFVRKPRLYWIIRNLTRNNLFANCFYIKNFERKHE
jgi:hypothetical protein